jgi:hypothetical protein
MWIQSDRPSRIVRRPSSSRSGMLCGKLMAQSLPLGAVFSNLCELTDFGTFVLFTSVDQAESSLPIPSLGTSQTVHSRGGALATAELSTAQVQRPHVQQKGTGP